jgi:tRNA nucleotidyltransferase (CCA-adding enzyme)
MTVSDVMNADVLSIAPEAPIEEARAVMRRRKIHHLVVRRGAQPIGVVSAHDLSSMRSTQRRPKTVADLMSRHLITIEGRASLDRAAYKMRNHAIGCLIVLNRGSIAGIVTTSDLLGRLGDTDQRRQRADARTAIHHRVVHRHRSRTNGVW